jgi:hypothetical protein
MPRRSRYSPDSGVYSLTPLTRGFSRSGGETRTHNLRINSPIRHDPLTRQNAWETCPEQALQLLTTPHHLALVFTIARPERVLWAGWPGR